jgi:hypothetical protein
MNHRTSLCSHLLLWLTFLFVIIGCQTATLQPSDIRLIENSGNITRIEGMKSALVASPDKPIFVMVIHGMNTNNLDYSKDTQAALAEKLGLKQKSPTKIFSIYRGYDAQLFSGANDLDPISQNSVLSKTSWSDPKQPSVDRLVFYELLWSPVRDAIKNKYLSCFELDDAHAPPGCPKGKSQKDKKPRVLINNFLKSNILVNGFADPMIVLSPAGDIIRDDMDLAMCMITNDILKYNDFSIKQENTQRCAIGKHIQDSEKSVANNIIYQSKFFIITESLGSFLLLDMQQRLMEDSNQDNEETLVYQLIDPSTVYMFANQISLLQLSRLTVNYCQPHNNESKCPNKRIKSVNAFPNDPHRGRITKYIAFNDADDLLGFEIQPYLAGQEGSGALVNISVKNSSLNIPGIVRWPSDVHGNYGNNPAVIDAIVNGFDVKQP